MESVKKPVRDDEFELYVPNGEDSFTMYSGSKRSGSCKSKRVNALPDIDLSSYRREGTENVINHNAEKWVYRVPTKCPDRYHIEYLTWWFAKLGEPQVEI